MASPERAGPDVRTAPGNGVPFIPAEAFRPSDSVVFLSSKFEVSGTEDVSQLIRNAQAGAVQPPALPPALAPAEVSPKVAPPAAEQPAQRQKVASLPGPTIG